MPVTQVCSLPELLHGDKLRLLCLIHHYGQRARMIRLHMIGHHVIEVLWGNYLLDPVCHLLVEGCLHRIDEGDLLIDNEIGIVGGPQMRGVAVEIPHITINGFHSVDAIR